MTLNVHIHHLGSAQRVLLQDLRLTVPPGHILSLMGPSGSGKSSVLAVIAGTLGAVADGAQALHAQARIELNGQDIGQLPTAQRGVGLLFQDPLLFGHWTVAENLLFAVPPGPRAQRLAQVQQALRDADLPDLGPRDPATLSGGQQARVALMRALLARPRALLLDEPFSRLDAALRQPLRAWVFAHIRQRQIPAVLVTHDRADVPEPEYLLELPHVR